MDEFSETSWDNIVALENIPSHIDYKQVFSILRRQGWITNIQFWISNNDKKHGFVTFREPEGASNCLMNRQMFAPPLEVRPVNPTSKHRYVPPEESPKGDLENKDAMLEDSPSLVSRLALPNETITPSREPQHPMSRLPAQNGAQDGKTRAVPMPTQSTIPNLPSQGAVDPRVASTFNSVLIGGAPSTSSPQMSTGSLIAILEESKKRGIQNMSLTSENQKLQSQLGEFKKIYERDLGAAIGDVQRYRAQRNDLLSQLEQEKKGTEHYKAKSEEYRIQYEDSKRHLGREGEVHRRNEEGLRDDLKWARDEMFKWKKDCENQSLLLKQRQSELEDTQEKLRALIEATTSVNEHGMKDAFQHKGNTSEPEEGQVYEPSETATSTLHNHTLPARGHKQLVMPALLTAFFHLDEIATAALRENGEKEQIGPNKRQKTTDDR